MDKVATVLPPRPPDLARSQSSGQGRAGTTEGTGRERGRQGLGGAEGLQGAGAGGLAGWMAAGRRAGQDRHETGTSQPSDRA